MCEMLGLFDPVPDEDDGSEEELQQERYDRWVMDQAPAPEPAAGREDEESARRGGRWSTEK